MGVSLKYKNSDEVFYRTHHNKIIVNDLSNRTVRDKAMVNNLLMLEVGETFDNVPSCQCGALSTTIYRGVRCSHCDTIVEEIVSNDLNNKMWVRAPEGVPAFMNPKLWHQLQAYLARSNYRFNLLQWLTDPTYKPSITKVTKPIERALARLDELGLNVRSYQHFYDNFDTYIRLFLTDKVFSTENTQSKKSATTKTTTGEDLLEMFMENKDNIWVQYIQVPNKALTIVEKNNGKKWVDPSTPKLLRALRLMVGIDNPENARGGVSVKTKLARTSKFLSFLGFYYNLDIDPKFLGSKPGLIRKHVIATRSNFTGRFVITAINGPHKHNEVRIPWTGFMNVFDPQIRAKIYHKYGYSSTKISQIMTKYNRKYNPELHKIMLELIEESSDERGNKGICVLINRNPSLKHGSIVRVRILPKIGVKTDVRDLSMSLSSTLVPLFNGDFDGDQMTLFVCLDNRMTQACEVFDPEYSVGDLINPYVADGVTSITKQTTMSVALGMVYHDEIEPTQEQIDFISQFAA